MIKKPPKRNIYSALYLERLPTKGASYQHLTAHVLVLFFYASESEPLQTDKIAFKRPILFF